MTATLRLRDPGFYAAIHTGRKTITVTGHRCVLAAKVDSHGIALRRNPLDSHRHRQAQPPVANSVLCEAPITPFCPVETLPLEHTEALAGKAQADAFAFQIHRFERHPTQRAPGTL